MKVNKKCILVLTSNVYQKSDLNYEENILIKSLISLGYDTNVHIFSDIPELINKLNSLKPQLVFNLFKNTADDISIQMSITGILELLKIPYIGNTPFVLGLSITKNFVKRLLENKRILSIPHQIYRDEPTSTYLKFPLILRPANMDWPTARIQSEKILDFTDLKDHVTTYLKKYKQPILVETLIPGRIFFVGIFGNNDPQILPVCEAMPMDKNYQFMCPPDIESELGLKIRDITLHVYKYLLGKDFALVSFLLDEKNQIYVADYHPNPSLFSGSIFQLSFKVSKYSFKEFLQNIIHGALK